jgi:hypothetical protein
MNITPMISESKTADDSKQKSQETDSCTAIQQPYSSHTAAIQKPKFYSQMLVHDS